MSVDAARRERAPLVIGIAFAHHYQLVVDLLHAGDFAREFLRLDLLFAVFDFTLQSDYAVLDFNVHRAALYHLVVGQLAPDEVVDLIVGNVLVRGPHAGGERENNE